MPSRTDSGILPGGPTRCGDPGEAPWLEVWEGALLLEAARTYPYGTPTAGTAGERLRAAIATALGKKPDAEEVFVQRMREAGKLASAERLAAYVAGTRQPTRDYLLTAARVLDLPEDRLYRLRGWISPRQGPSSLLYPVLPRSSSRAAGKPKCWGWSLET